MDGLTIEADMTELLAALDRLPVEVERRLNAAAKVTAYAIRDEAKNRLARQLGQNATGRMVDSISVQEDYTGNGYVILTNLPPDATISAHTSKKTGRTHTQKVSINLLPIWLEKGTRRGEGKHANIARPYFYASVLLEAGEHERRVLQALQDAADDCGLGE